jgi:hypothetical protein
MKSVLPGCSFTEADELFEAIGDFFDTPSDEELKSVFDGWIERMRWVIAHNGEYYQSLSDHPLWGKEVFRLEMYRTYRVNHIYIYAICQSKWLSRNFTDSSCTAVKP